MTQRNPLPYSAGILRDILNTQPLENHDEQRQFLNEVRNAKFDAKNDVIIIKFHSEYYTKMSANFFNQILKPATVSAHAQTIEITQQNVDTLISCYLAQQQQQPRRLSAESKSKPEAESKTSTKSKFQMPLLLFKGKEVLDPYKKLAAVDKEYQLRSRNS